MPGETAPDARRLPNSAAVIPAAAQRPLDRAALFVRNGGLADRAQIFERCVMERTTRLADDEHPAMSHDGREGEGVPGRAYDRAYGDAGGGVGGHAGLGSSSAAGWLLGWSWFDTVARWALKRWFFPLSRLWAAAGVADGSIDRFYEAIPFDPLRGPRRGVAEALARFEQARAYAGALDAAWEKAFFGGRGIGGGKPSPAELRALEDARLACRHRYNATRADFRFLLRLGAPGVRYDIPTPDEAHAIYGDALADPAALFAPPDPMPHIEVSLPVETRHGRDYWLRFPSPSARLGDIVHARVHEPAGAVNPPTVIFGHGTGMEFDHWRGLIDETAALLARGIRVIRPEAPWHGRRTPRGYFGGERMISAFPLGLLDTIAGAAREWAALADWARRTSSGPLAFGGASLGALTAQLAADRARRQWPERLRPDALFLMAHSWRLTDAIREGELMEILGGRGAVEARGWREETLARYLDLLAPGPEPALPPERIVSVLGRYDRITPFSSGADLINSWGVPLDNRFIWKRGHFSIPAASLRLTEPADRLRQVLG